MEHKPALYLTGTAHYLGRAEAYNIAKDRICEIWEEEDGTYTINFLSQHPRWPGQVKWIGRGNHD